MNFIDYNTSFDNNVEYWMKQFLLTQKNIFLLLFPIVFINFIYGEFNELTFIIFLLYLVFYETMYFISSCDIKHKLFLVCFVPCVIHLCFYNSFSTNSLRLFFHYPVQVVISYAFLYFHSSYFHKAIKQWQSKNHPIRLSSALSLINKEKFLNKKIDAVNNKTRAIISEEYLKYKGNSLDVKPYVFSFLAQYLFHFTFPGLGFLFNRIYDEIKIDKLMIGKTKPRYLESLLSQTIRDDIEIYYSSRKEMRLILIGYYAVAFFGFTSILLFWGA